MKLEAKIEALLFWKAEPISIKKLASLLNENEDSIRKALSELHIILSERGIILIENNDEVTLGTSKDASELIESLTKDELSKDLGKAGLETLSIILYQGPISRAEIDYIRGVNSQFILRNLLVRGLIERIENPNDQRSYLYKSTLELLSYLGISKIELGNREITTSELIRIARALGTPVDSLTGNNENYIYNEEIKIVEALREIPFEDYKRIISVLEASVYYTAKDVDDNKKAQLLDLVTSLASFVKNDQRPRPIQKNTNIEKDNKKTRNLH